MAKRATKHKLIIFFSGAAYNNSPERHISSESPDVMLTFYEILNRGGALKRFKRHRARRKQDANKG